MPILALKVGWRNRRNACWWKASVANPCRLGLWGTCCGLLAFIEERFVLLVLLYCLFFWCRFFFLWGKIPPNSTLVFYTELVDVKAPGAELYWGHFVSAVDMRIRVHWCLRRKAVTTSSSAKMCVLCMLAVRVLAEGSLLRSPKKSILLSNIRPAFPGWKWRCFPSWHDVQQRGTHASVQDEKMLWTFLQHEKAEAELIKMWLPKRNGKRQAETWFAADVIWGNSSYGNKWRPRVRNNFDRTRDMSCLKMSEVFAVNLLVVFSEASPCAAQSLQALEVSSNKNMRCAIQHVWFHMFQSGYARQSTLDFHFVAFYLKKKPSLSKLWPASRAPKASGWKPTALSQI